ncbi:MULTISPECIES: hypothetical protein [unclassified Coleofasciculus]|uniref:hypothetical protein n=1 Tax=unclassified Coleofasciculus TaxID=2692782 RepID=UPI00187FAC9E|nr:MULTISPECIES: hypothetical protein [unclassified Coleofasciculus]MBE9128018.1 hypothetical protein [Coleofasciculus sp. LEGE 07081]MBE9150542.1 hypothetical protein [Coleofasciculus sp. LEGE 07092]
MVLNTLSHLELSASEEKAIGNFENWQNSFIDEIPNLKDVSFSQFPGGIAGTGTDVGTADLILKNVEQQRSRTISGSDQEGFTVPCETNCAHVELAGSPKVMGRQWISGKYQEVKGGFGVLGQANGGKEPTGIHPFGEAFKMVLWDVNDDESAISSMLFFRICKRGVPDLGCTPYFIGGLPFMTFTETTPMFLGSVEDLPTQSITSSPSSSQSENPETSKPFNTETFINSQPSCTASVNMEALSQVLSGNADIANADIADMAELIDIASSQIDPTTQLPFTGVSEAGRDSAHRLIERIAQMHFGGVGIPIDSAATDVNGLSAKDFGTQTKELYQDFQKSYCP